MLRWIAICWLLAPVPIVVEEVVRALRVRDDGSSLLWWVVTAGAWLLACAFWRLRGDGIRLAVGVLSGIAALVASFMGLAVLYAPHADPPMGAFFPLWAFGSALLGGVSVLATFLGSSWDPDGPRPPE